MINLSYLVKTGILLLAGLVVPFVSHAQFIDLRLDIEAEITARTDQALDFGILTTNSGRRAIDLGSTSMGIFSITALENQMLLITLNKPKTLQHDNQAITEEIPIQLYARFGYSAQNYQDSAPLPDGMGSIKVEPNPNPGPWNTIYLFMYGTINIGNIPDGTYSDDIILNVEYI